MGLELSFQKLFSVVPIVRFVSYSLRESLVILYFFLTEKKREKLLNVQLASLGVLLLFRVTLDAMIVRTLQLVFSHLLPIGSGPNVCLIYVLIHCSPPPSAVSMLFVNRPLQILGFVAKNNDPVTVRTPQIQLVVFEFVHCSTAPLPRFCCWEHIHGVVLFL